MSDEGRTENLIEPLSKEELSYFHDKVKKIDLSNGSVAMNPGLFDLLAMASFGSESRVKVIITIVRKTWCVHTKSAVITNEDFVRATGLTKGQVSKSLGSLVKANVVICLNPESTHHRQYRFNKYPDTWKGIERAKWTESKKITKVRKKLKEMKKDEQNIRVSRHLKKLIALEFVNGSVINRETVTDMETVTNKERVVNAKTVPNMATVSRKDLLIIIDYINRLLFSGKIEEQNIIKSTIHNMLLDMYRKRYDIKIYGEVGRLEQELVAVFRKLFVNDYYRPIFDMEKDLKFWSEIMLNKRYSNVDLCGVLDAINSKLIETQPKKANPRLMARNWVEISVKKGWNQKGGANVPGDRVAKDQRAREEYRRKYPLTKRP